MKWNYIITGLLGLILVESYKRNRAPVIYVVDTLPGNHNAVCIPPAGIFITSNHCNNRLLIEHELVHWRQYQERGLFNFCIDYMQELKDYGYDSMPMEIEARHNEPDHVKINYTEAVRTGQALTVYNPNFRM